MKCFCIVQQSNPASMKLGKRAKDSAKKHHDDQFEFIDGFVITSERAREYLKKRGLFLKYSPRKDNSSSTDFTQKLAPKKRIGNGLTHYFLYEKCVSIDQTIMILEHDAYFISNPIDSVMLKFLASNTGCVIQISSHISKQLNLTTLKESRRGQKMSLFEPERLIPNTWRNGVIPHPLSGTVGTSGYIITPRAASKMIEYLRCDGIGFADRVREEHLGKGSLFLQIPQSVLCSTTTIQYT